ncbi:MULTISPECIES: hypothetical protein [Bacillus]|uniref:Hydrolase n=2 Tax=Bacillus TaxID=1386 RepID=A0A0M4FS39_9BACI|nr:MULTISPECIES: hypothetical protein [Bacillus]ALC80718.1 hypothetical protein AM592_03275 [Bacillus gobiensis]MBP1079613.1 hypothetical protein [Bacillus capparidis]MED1095014.1 hypothetical protein [Bacillus capparidis]
MTIFERFFQFESEWNAIHIPYRPNGFGVLVLGDRNHFVKPETSFWLEHDGKYRTIQLLLSEGYTIFYSNLFNPHWGAKKASDYTRHFIHYVLKHEILNEKIHIIAEGTGALVAANLLNESEEQIRSVAMLTPCLDLQSYYENEKENKFFYKQLVKQLEKSYGIPEKEMENFRFQTIIPYHNKVPVHIWQRMNGAYPYDAHAKIFEEKQMNGKNQVKVTYYLADHPNRIRSSILKFFKRHEKEL